MEKDLGLDGTNKSVEGGCFEVKLVFPSDSLSPDVSRKKEMDCDCALPWHSIHGPWSMRGRRDQSGFHVDGPLPFHLRFQTLDDFLFFPSGNSTTRWRSNVSTGWLSSGVVRLPFSAIVS